MNRDIAIDLSAVIFSVRDDQPRVLTVPPAAGGDSDALPSGPFDADQHRTLELGLRSWVNQQTGQDLGYVEQLYTFADEGRDPREHDGGPRLVSVAYLGLGMEAPSGDGQQGRSNCYRFLPWEDWRAERPAMIDDMRSRLIAWTKTAPDAAQARQRRERVDICLGLGQSGWDGFKVLERYELLYEAGLVNEALRDSGASAQTPTKDGFGEAMAYDHRRMLATALARVRGKLRYRPVVFELLEPEFTLNRLQRVVEALAGLPLHKQNFRRLVDRGGLVEGTGKQDASTGGRPAELFRFRREVLRERRAPGVSTIMGPGRQRRGS
ncbi:MAG: NAD regulator [Pseudomonadota bacterium]